MNKVRLGREVFVLSIMTLITVVTWIIIEVYAMATKTTIPQVTQEQMLPLDPNLNKDVIDSLKSSLSFTQ